MTELCDIRAVASDDLVKRDLELRCTNCNKHLCDIEDGDDMEVLNSVAQSHLDICEGTP